VIKHKQTIDIIDMKMYTINTKMSIINTKDIAER